MYTKRALIALSTILSSAIAATKPVVEEYSNSVGTFDAYSNTNMAVYWGQGPSQKRLAHFCADSSIDIIPIAFLNIFPDQVGGGYPGTNFGNQCGDATYRNKDGSWSPLLSDCPLIGPDIKTCQALGKKILLSLGGAIPTNQSIPNDEAAVSFANFLWNAYGPVNFDYKGPRPFGDAIIDGFDFDIESSVTGGDESSLYRGYAKMINTLRQHYATAEKKFYISGAPQCVVPDTHFAQPIETSWFDFLFIQFYNTPQCSARAYFDASYGSYDGQPTVISFDKWVAFIRNTALNKDVKLFIGLPAAPLPQLAYDTTMYIAPDDVRNLIDLYQCRYPKEFGGIMVFEATYSEQNLINGEPYVDALKSLLTKCDCAQKPTTTSSLPGPTPSSSAIISSSVPSSAATSSSPVVSASGSLPTYPSSTGTWNSSAIPTSSIFAGTGSSLIPPYTSNTGIWNSTYTPGPTVPIPTGAGPSSIPSYSSDTGIWNSTFVPGPTVPLPTGTGSSAIPSYPSSTGIWNSTHITGPIVSIPTGTGYPSSSIPISNPASYSVTLVPNSTYTVNTSTPIETPSSLTYTTTVSSGTSIGVTTSNASYPINNVTSSLTTTSHSEDIYTTEAFTTTSYPPEVTNSPTRTFTSVYPTVTPSDTSIASTLGSSPTSTVPESLPLITSKPSATTTEGGLVTVIVTSYTTTCPVVNTITTGGSQSIQTTFTISTVYSTITSTVCTKCTASATAVPVPIGGNSPVGGNTGTGSAPAPGTGSEGSGSPPAPGPQQPPQSPNSGNSPVGSGNSPAAPHSPTGPAHGGSPSSGSPPYTDTGNAPVPEGGLNSHQPQAPPVLGEGQSTTMLTSTKQITATVVPVPVGGGVPPSAGANSPPGANIPGSVSSPSPVMVTATLVPVPLNPSQTAQAGPSGSVVSAPGSSLTPGVPFPAGNGTTPGGPSGTSSASASSGSLGVGSVSTAIPFTGAASGIGSSILGFVVAAVAAALLA